MKKAIGFLTFLFFLTFAGFASAEYTDNEDGTITDSRSSLMWQQTPARGDWDTANSYCTQSGTGGYTDWRMPTLTELQVLIDPAYDYPAINPVFSCPTDPHAFTWTSSVEGDSAWIVSFQHGDIMLRAKSAKTTFVRCVRGATAPPPSQYDLTGIWQVVGQGYYFSLYIKGSSVIIITFVPGQGEGYMLGDISGNTGQITYASDLTQFNATFTATSATTGTLTVNNCVPFSGEICLLPVGSTFSVVKIF